MEEQVKDRIARRNQEEEIELKFAEEQRAQANMLNRKEMELDNVLKELWDFDFLTYFFYVRLIPGKEILRKGYKSLPVYVSTERRSARL